MSASNDRLRQLADELPADLAGEIVCIAEALRARRSASEGAAAPSGMTDQDRVWLAAGMADTLAGLAAVESETPPEEVAAWLEALEAGSTRVRWDEELGELVEVAG